MLGVPRLLHGFPGPRSGTVPRNCHGHRPLRETTKPEGSSLKVVLEGTNEQARDNGPNLSAAALGERCECAEEEDECGDSQ